MRCFVPTADPGEVWTVLLRNRLYRHRRPKVSAFYNTIFDGFLRPPTYYMTTGDFDEPSQAVLLRKWQGYEDQLEPFSYLMLSSPLSGRNCASSEFVGHGNGTGIREIQIHGRRLDETLLPVESGRVFSVNVSVG